MLGHHNMALLRNINIKKYWLEESKRNNFNRCGKASRDSSHQIKYLQEIGDLPELYDRVVDTSKG
jgi:hypothetical protein